MMPVAAPPFSIPEGAYVLASLSRVDLANSSKRTKQLWEARALALHHLAAGDMAEALKVMSAARAGGHIPSNPEPNQPRSAAKEAS